MQRRTNDSGQALVETAIIVPFLLFVFLCMLQIMFIAHARVLLDYAAFNAARAGVVHNGNPTVMRSAALLSMLPAFGRVDTPEHALETWGKVQLWAGIGGVVDAGTHAVEGFLGDLFGNQVNFSGIFPNVSVVAVDILNPALEDFEPYKPRPGDNEPVDDRGLLAEIDLDLAARLDEGKQDPEAVRKTRLTIRVQWLYVMRVPAANALLYRMYMLGSYMRAQLQRAQWQNWYNLRMQNGQDADLAIANQDFAAFDASAWPRGWKVAIRDQIMFQLLKRLPEATETLGVGAVYIMPLYAVTSMPMESNLYRKFVE